MLRDITLGQYIPGDTVIHRLDPRCKIILTILYIAVIFCVTSPVWYVIPLAYLLVASRLSGLSAKRLLKSVKPLRFLLILTFRRHNGVGGLGIPAHHAGRVPHRCAFQHAPGVSGGGHLAAHPDHLSGSLKRRPGKAAQSPQGHPLSRA